MQTAHAPSSYAGSQAEPISTDNPSLWQRQGAYSGVRWEHHEVLPRSAALTSSHAASADWLAPNGLPYSPKSRKVAGLLQLFLGYLGVGRFYTGHVWTGIAMLLTAGGCVIWALIDAILFFRKTDRTDKKGRVLRG
ncbi:TM2 domain-containing protein [Streptomyces chartreusis]|uniref:TM2 domain-containing protein n=1 Tax=Streptomyces chartreusis TaxID=1969 RepID=UPI0036C9923F